MVQSLDKINGLLKEDKKLLVMALRKSHNSFKLFWTNEKEFYSQL